VPITFATSPIPWRSRRKKRLAACLVAPVLDEDVEQVAVLVDRAPEVLLLAVGRDGDLVEVPLVAGPKGVPCRQAR
jgi:hypothetical protein